jgi:hypothetical protein
LTQISKQSQPTRLSDSPAQANNPGGATVSLEHIAPERRRAWTQIISEAFTFLGREVPGGERLKMAIRTFDGLCQEIPTGLLKDVYDLSMNYTEENGSVPFWDGRLLLRVWKINEPTLREKLSAGLLTTTRRVNCPDCFGNSTGRKWTTNKYNIATLSSEICMHENDPGDEEEDAKL